MRFSERHFLTGGVWIASLVFAFAIGRSRVPAEGERTSPPREADSAGVEEGAAGRVSPSRRSRRAGRGTRRDIASWVAGQGEAPRAAEGVDPGDIQIRTEEALRDVDPIRRWEQFGRVLRDLDATNIQEVLRLFEELPPGYERDQEFSLLLYRWAQFDGESAATYVQSMSESRTKRRAMFNALTGWASQDSDAALAWAQSQFEGEREQNMYMIGVINGIVQTDLVRATELTQSLPDGRGRYRAVGLLLDGYLREGMDVGLAWVEGIEDAGLQRVAADQLARRMTDSDVERFAEWAAALRDGELQESVVNAFARQWARTSPEAAAAWAESLPATELQVAAMSSVVRSWARRDPAATGEWLRQFSPSLDMDTILLAYIDRVDGRDPSLAMPMALRLTDAEIREQKVGDLQARITNQQPQ